MPANIITFPKKDTKQDSSQVEQVIREWLAKLDATDDLTEYVVTHMLAFIDNYASKTFEPMFNLTLPSNLPRNEVDNLLKSLDEGVYNATNQVREMINKIIIERFFLEIDIYNCTKRNYKIVK